MGMKINKVFDANIYVNGGSTHGTASEVTCPDVEANMVDYNALGMVGTAQFFNGFNAMEATIKWKFPNSDVFAAMADPQQAVDLMVRSSKAVYDSGGVSDEEPIVIYMRGFAKKTSVGGFKKGEDTEPETTFGINYYKLEINREEIVELDVLNNIYKVGGIDVLSERRSNLGI